MVNGEQGLLLDPYALVQWGAKLQQFPNALYSVSKDTLPHASETEHFSLGITHQHLKLLCCTSFIKSTSKLISLIIHLVGDFHF